MHSDDFLQIYTADAVTDRATVNATGLALDRFLAGVERRAFVTAELATQNRDDALDIVQDSMMAFARRYGHKPESDWAPLFHRILQNKIRDWHRRGVVRRHLFGWLSRSPEERVDNQVDVIQTLPDPAGRNPETRLSQQLAGDEVVTAISNLPVRQREAFTLRVWEGLDVASTAHVMGCSSGSVKTHLSRALAALRAHLQDHYE